MKNSTGLRLGDDLNKFIFGVLLVAALISGFFIATPHAFAASSTVTNVTSSTANGSYKAGQVISVQITFSRTETVTGTPQLTLSTGNPATTAVNYVSGTGTNTLTFNYTVVAGNTSADLNYAATNSLTLNGGTIKNSNTNATLTLPALAGAGSLGTNKNIVIDTTAPTNQNSVFAASIAKIGGASVVIVSSGDTTNNVWFAPSGTTVFTAGSTMTKAANGLAITILAPATAGAYKLFVLDMAGNISAASTATLTVDNTNPTSTISSPTDNSFSSSTTVALSGTSSDANLTTTTISIDGGVFQATSSTAASWTLSATGLSVGSHTFQTKATDSAGNTGLSSLVHVTVDITAPTISGLSDDPVPTKSKTWNWDSELGASFRFVVDSISSWLSPSGVFDGTKTTTQSSGNGTYYLHVQAKDLAGNVSDVTTVSAILDNIASFLSNIDSDGQTYNLASASPHTIKLTFNEDVSNTPTISVNSSGQSVAGCSDVDAKTFCFDYTIPSATNYTPMTIQVSGAQDSAGNIMDSDNSHTFVVDTLAPELSFADSAEIGPVMSDNIAINYGDSSVDKYGFVASGTDCIPSVDISGFTDYSSIFSVSDISQNGKYVCAYGADIAGNKSAIASTNPLNIDVTAPTIIINNPDTNPTQSKTITAETNEGTLTQSITTDSVCDGTLDFAPYSSQTFISESDNGKRVCYKAVDGAGNMDYESSFPIGGIDTTPPTLSEVIPVSTPNRDNTPNYIFNSTETGDIAYNEDCSSGTPVAVSGGNTIIFNTLSDGVHNTCTIKVTDAAGNQGTLAVSAFTVDTAPPVITPSGDNPTNLLIGDTYLEAGASVNDNIDSSVTLNVGGDTVSTVAVDTFYVTYDAVDTAGNNAEQVVRTVNVSEVPAPVISEQTPSTPTETSFTVTWTTNHSATSRVIYDTVSHPILGLAPNYDYANSTVETDNTLPLTITSHSVVVSGLTAGTTYYFRTVSHGSPEAISDELSGSTSTAPTPTPNGGGGGGGSYYYPTPTPTPTPTPSPTLSPSPLVTPAVVGTVASAPVATATPIPTPSTTVSGSPIPSSSTTPTPSAGPSLQQATILGAFGNVFSLGTGNWFVALIVILAMAYGAYWLVKRKLKK